MSYILDALKKSESERLRQDAPGFADVPNRVPGKSPARWIWIVAALLLVNVAALVAVVFRPGQEPPQEIAAQDVAHDAASPSFSDIVRQAKRNAAADVAVPVAETAAPAPSTVEPPAGIAPPMNDEPIELATVTEAPATFNDLRAQGVLQLPDMHLDIHVYSGRPEDRFVFVNMSKYTERATLSEGPLVREITPEGVILQYQGTEFLLPRE